jgi:hypothetical protein
MSVYLELCAAAQGLFTRVDHFCVAANAFPERFRRALCAYLEAPEDSVGLQRWADKEPHGTGRR